MNWYFTWHRPNMKAVGGAFWPIMAIRYHNKEGNPYPSFYTQEVIEHEEGHMKDQLIMLLIFWLILYVIFHVIYGYQKNPFEVWARVVAITNKWNWFGWIKYV